MADLFGGGLPCAWAGEALGVFKAEKKIQIEMNVVLLAILGWGIFFFLIATLFKSEKSVPEKALIKEEQRFVDQMEYEWNLVFSFG